MGKKNDVPLKEKYRLWWEYLNRSGLYNRLLEKARSSLMLKRNGHIISELFTAAHREKIENERLFIDSITFFQSLIQGQSFDEWWEKGTFYIPAKGVKLADISRDVEMLLDCFEEKIGWESSKHRAWRTYIDSFYDSKTREDLSFLGGEEGEGILAEPLMGADLIIRIDKLHFWKNDQIEKEIRKIIRNRKKELRRSSTLFSGKLRYKQVSRYLDVYDKVESLKAKRMKWEKITREFYSPLAKRLEEKNIPLKSVTRIFNRLENHERRLKMEYSKAKTIIKNTEKGIFPGKY